LGAAYPPRAPIRVKFRTAKRTHVLLDHVKVHVNRRELPLRGENTDFRHPSKFNTGSLSHYTNIYKLIIQAPPTAVAVTLKLNLF